MSEERQSTADASPKGVADTWRGLVNGVRRQIPGAGADAGPVTIWERLPDGWRVAEGDLAGSAPAVRRVARFEGDPDRETLRARGFARGRQAVIVVGMERSFCRVLDLPTESDAEIRQILGLRLETELPYAVESAVWAYAVQSTDPQTSSSRVLVLALPADEIERMEDAVRGAGRTPVAIESREAALAQLAPDLAPGEAGVAVAEVDEDAAALVVVAPEGVTYARHIPAAGSATPDRLADEMAQSLRHYSLATHNGMPEKLILASGTDLAERISQAARLKVVPAGRAVCAGALELTRRRSAGEPVRVPALRRRKTADRRTDARRTGTLAALVLVLLVAAIAMGFGLRRARIEAVSAAIEAGRESTQDFQVLQEEVEIMQKEQDAYRSTLDILRSVVEAFPEQVKITDIEMDSRNRVTIRGKAPSVEMVSKAEAALAGSDMFASAQFRQAARGQGGLTFQVDCELR